MTSKNARATVTQLHLDQCHNTMHLCLKRSSPSVPVAVVAIFVRSGTGPAQVGLAQLANRVNPPCSSGETSRASRKYSQLPTIGCMHGSG